MPETKRRSISTTGLPTSTFYINNADNTVPSPYNPVYLDHTNISTGDDAQNRTGRQCHFTRFKLDCWITLDGAKDLPSNVEGFPIRMLTVVVHDNNGVNGVSMATVQRLFAQLDPLTEYGQGAAVFAPVPPESRDNFTVLDDQRGFLRPANPKNQTATPTEVTMQPNTEDTQLFFSFDLKVDLVATYGPFATYFNRPLTNSVYSIFFCPFMPYAANIPVSIEAWPRIFRAYRYCEFSG